MLFVDWWLLVVDYLPPLTPLLSPSPLPYGKPRRARLHPIFNTFQTSSESVLTKTIHQKRSQ
ncbi:hypothetical protein [Fischerella thermalis]|uniref:hypothetical protein n=1 Tax=Fischerella thermalis TaxID=372787 RepID=UPI0002DA1020|nr:hypothetical protein [Fischerella thermalis]